MIKVDSENGQVNVQMDGHVYECLADTLCAIHAMGNYFRDRPKAFATFREFLTKMVNSGMMFEDLSDDEATIFFPANCRIGKQEGKNDF